MNTPEASNVETLQITKETELWEKHAPQEWKDLPKSHVTTYQFEDGDGNRRCAEAATILHKCEGPRPTDEEAIAALTKVKERGKPVAFLSMLCSFQVPSWPNGDDPSVKDFFEGNFDPSTMTSKAVLVIYPNFEETK